MVGTVVPESEPAGGADVELAEGMLASLDTVRRQARRIAGRAWPIAPLTGSQVELLRLVRRHPDISIAEAAVELGSAANTVSTLVRQLVEVGLLRRVADPADRRVARLSLTAAARRRVNAWRDRRAAVVAVALGDLSAADRWALAAALPALGRLFAALHDREATP